MNNHGKKMIAPIVISIIVLLFCVPYLLAVILTDLPMIMRLVVGGIALAVAIAMIVTLVGRIREIEGGEEDDLNNY